MTDVIPVRDSVLAQITKTTAFSCHDATRILSIDRKHLILVTHDSLDCNLGTKKAGRIRRPHIIATATRRDSSEDAPPENAATSTTSSDHSPSEEEKHDGGGDGDDAAVPREKILQSSEDQLEEGDHVAAARGAGVSQVDHGHRAPDRVGPAPSPRAGAKVPVAEEGQQPDGEGA
jgi:hypothetical protein